MNTLTQAQNIMLTKLEMYCHSNHTQIWTGDTSELNKIGGRDLLYELEQAGVVTINRIRERWLVYPNRSRQ